MLEHLTKYPFWEFFEQISAVPRGSGDNQKISDFLVKFAKERGFSCTQDEALNVIIRKPATPGYEQAPGVILQGHMDMVCEKESGVQHDFTREGLLLQCDEEYVSAQGTTLGGDDGIALAYGMAVFNDDSLVHPALELVVTTDEETGMYGAKALDSGSLKGKYLINLDSEEEGSLLAGCAGGLRVDLRKNGKTFLRQGIPCKIRITGLRGGHSGSEIDKNRTNGTLLLARCLYELKICELYLESMEGGTKDNAIPREAEASLLIPEQYQDRIQRQWNRITEQYRKELAGFEPGLRFELEWGEQRSCEVFEPDFLEDLLFLLLTVPDGVQVMSGEMEGLVESSLNMGIFRADRGEMRASFSIRSSCPGYKEYIGERLKLIGERIGAEYIPGEAYPAWVYQSDSRLRRIMEQVFEQYYGRRPVIEVIHAGLECGIIFDARPEMDIVSIGPDIEDIHTPKERLSIASADRTYEYLLQVLRALAEQTEEGNE